MSQIKSLRPLSISISVAVHEAFALASIDPGPGKGLIMRGTLFARIIAASALGGTCKACHDNFKTKND
jgi:hypothetical protein